MLCVWDVEVEDVAPLNPAVRNDARPIEVSSQANISVLWD
jgi:hypothetical protein